MVRKLVSGTAAVIVAMGLLVAATSGVASAKAPKAVGIANCPIYSGTGTLNPALDSGAPGGVKITFTATLTPPGGPAPCGNSSITKPAGVTIVGGTVTGSGFYKALPAGLASSCANFHGTDVVGKIKVKIAWMTVPPGAIADTTIVYKNNPNTVSGAPQDTIKLLAPPGTAVKTGSFSAGTLNTTALQTNIPAPPCAAPVSNFNIVGGNVLV